MLVHIATRYVLRVHIGIILSFIFVWAQIISMRIRFSDEEHEQLLELLQYNVDACSDEEVAIVNHFIAKLKAAENYSWSNARKLRGVAKETRWEYDIVRPFEKKHGKR